MLGLFALAGLGCLAVAETLFRHVPVSEGTGSVAIALPGNGPHQPNVERAWSRGWLFQVRNRIKANNRGWISGQPYESSASTPLLALIGDSFIEALQVPWERTCTAHLARGVSPSLRVYSFATSGAPLSHYLHLAATARVEYGPTHAVFVIVHNDFDESIRESGERLFYQFVREDARRGWVLAGPATTIHGRRYRVARSAVAVSATAAYAARNMALLEWPEIARQYGRMFGGEYRRGSTRDRLGQAATTEFLHRVPAASGLSRRDIAFAMNAVQHPAPQRPLGGIEWPLHRAVRERLEFQARRREHFVTSAKQMGHEVLDLNTAFREAARRDPDGGFITGDGHWNETGHVACAEAIRTTRLFSRFSAAPVPPRTDRQPLGDAEAGEATPQRPRAAATRQKSPMYSRAKRAGEKSASACSLAAPPIARCTVAPRRWKRSNAAAIVSGRSGSTRNPVTPSRTRRRLSPVSDAMTGTPHAAASQITLEHPS